MTLQRYPHQTVDAPQRSRRRAKQHEERLRRDRRELARDLSERVARGCYPVREDGPVPRID